MSLTRVLSVALAVSLLAACSKSSEPDRSKAVPATAPAAKDPAAARTLIAAGAIVVDVRSAEEYGSGHLPQSTNIPIGDFAARLAEVETLTGGDKTKPIVVHCAAGGRAARAKQQLDAAGYTTVVNGGGLDDLR